MAFAILKLSYNAPGDSSLIGGICGTGFFVNGQTAVTAYHVLNNETFRPNGGFRYASVWLLCRSGSILKIREDSASLHPEIDSTIIRFRDRVPQAQTYEPLLGAVVNGMEVLGVGHVGNSMPSVQADWQGSELVIRSANLTGAMTDVKGLVKRSVTFNVNANDIKLRGVRGFELGFGSRVGMSGGPVVDNRTGQVLGMLSIGLPQDSEVKTETFVVSIDEIWKHLAQHGT
ncbi:trypsin-like peptidase domain-containing protein [Candidatus Methylomirabilis sp.]|uniref:trypsin-like peptidase domain-containing protein n=1 Tax=Candidatus Methylomirabilis sp. TaxID=2032687 RepID=UPI002A65482C|nr:trypsin-like peptidase domain-containing protein [Candidatus Methylomirabilis sp.]